MLALPNQKTIRIMTFFWILLILTVLVVPAPREWGFFGKWIGPRYDLVRPILQPAAHVVLMAVLASLLMRCFVHKRRLDAIFITGGFAMLLALGFEFMQLLLPRSFGRAGDMQDMVFALIGVGIGCATSLLSNIWQRN